MLFVGGRKKEEEEKDEVGASFLCCSVWPMSRKTSSSSSSSLAFGLAAIKISLAFFLLLSSGGEEKDFFLQHEKSLSINPKEKEGLLCISRQRAESATCILRKVGDCCSLFFFLFFLFSSKSSFRLRSPSRPHVDASSQMRPSSSGIHQKEHR